MSYHAIQVLYSPDSFCEDDATVPRPGFVRVVSIVSLLLLRPHTLTYPAYSTSDQVAVTVFAIVFVNAIAIASASTLIPTAVVDEQLQVVR